MIIIINAYIILERSPMSIKFNKNIMIKSRNFPQLGTF